MRVPLAALVLLAACATPADEPAGPRSAPAASATPGGEALAGPPARPAFDAAGWTAAVRAAETDSALAALSDRLLDAANARRACDEEGEPASGQRLVQIRDVGAPGGRVLAEVTCQTGAYQSTFVLVDVAPERPPALVRAAAVASDGQPTDGETVRFVGLLSVPDGPAEAFRVWTKGAGHGGCGTDVRYGLPPGAVAEVAEVRAHDDCAEPLAPEAWPVVYRAAS